MLWGTTAQRLGWTDLPPRDFVLSRPLLPVYYALVVVYALFLRAHDYLFIGAAAFYAIASVIAYFNVRRRRTMSTPPTGYR